MLPAENKLHKLHSLVDRWANKYKINFVKSFFNKPLYNQKMNPQINIFKFIFRSIKKMIWRFLGSFLHLQK